MVKDICDEGAINLIQAIVNRAGNDVLHSAPGSEMRKQAEEFFLSDWFQAITGLDGAAVLKPLQAEYDRKHKKKGMKKYGYE